MLTRSGAARRGRARRPPAWLIVSAVVMAALGVSAGVMMAASGRTPAIAVSESAHRARATPGASAPAAAANLDCTLIVPASPLSASGLATPYQLTGPGGQDPAASGCTESNPDLQAFVQATILDPATGRLSVYEPLVVTRGSAPAVAPVRPHLPRHAVVNVMVGFNGDSLRLAGAGPRTLARADCVNGLGDSLFGQVSYCNSAAFYAAADRDLAEGRLRVPASGTSPLTGQPCPTTRSFDLVDQDPSDNVTTEYLLTADGATAQDNVADRAVLPGAATISNGSDNALLDNFVLPALGCTPFTAPDLSDAGMPGTSQTLDELSAAANQRAPVALVPENDPMTLLGGQLSAAKTGLYRTGVGQPLVTTGQQADTPANFCANMLNIQTAFIAANQQRFSVNDSPAPATGTNLLTFMAARLSTSFANLGCAAFGLRNTVSLHLDDHAVAVAATLSLIRQQPGTPSGSGMPGPAAPASQPWLPWTPWGQAEPGVPGYESGTSGF
ncbi:MAG TPA: hypothetical protein VEF71_27465 [Streptosporangiaceae bacterium]|nr:hypothetical protein [Streptosporangiaceae bacterium]